MEDDLDNTEEYDDLGYFDSDESYASDYVDDSYEEENNSINEPINNKIIDKFDIYPDTYLPEDLMKEILYRADIHGYIKLCNSNKKFGKLCDSKMWATKFKQHPYIRLKTQPSTPQGIINEWVKEYKHYMNNIKYHDMAKKFINGLTSQKSIIKLNKVLGNDILPFLSTMPRINDQEGDYRQKYKRNNDYMRIEIKNNNYILDNNEILTLNEFQELIYHLFYNGYLDTHHTYYYNDYGWYITIDNAYQRYIK